MNAPDRDAVRDDARRACIAATVRDDVQALTRYAVADAEGYIKLDAMENPYALPAEVAAALGEAISRVPINRYPDGDARAVKDALRAALKLPTDVSLWLGKGLDEQKRNLYGQRQRRAQCIHDRAGVAVGKAVDR